MIMSRKQQRLFRGLDKERARITTSASSALHGRAWIDAQYLLEQKQLLEVRKLSSAVTRQMSELPPEWNRRSGRLAQARTRKDPDKSRDVVVGAANSMAKNSQRLQQDQTPSRLSNNPPRRTRGRQVGPLRVDRGKHRYVLPVTGKPYGSVRASTWSSTAKKKGILTLARLRELRRMARRQKPQPSALEVQEKYRVQKKFRELRKKNRDLRMENLSRSLAAGAPVGVYPGSPPGWSPRGGAAKMYGKAVRWRRVPGSFENGKRR